MKLNLGGIIPLVCAYAVYGINESLFVFQEV